MIVTVANLQAIGFLLVDPVVKVIFEPLSFIVIIVGWGLLLNFLAGWLGSLYLFLFFLLFFFKVHLGLLLGFADFLLLLFDFRVFFELGRLLLELGFFKGLPRFLEFLVGG